MTDTLKIRIIQKLDLLPTKTLEQVLSFIEFLVWQKKAVASSAKSTPEQPETWQPEDRQWLESDVSNLALHEPYEWQPGEAENGTPVTINFDQGTITIQE
ncbi:MAG: hypothetical protein AAF152_05100 [Cyanobacteria bacterium P01_A01_bin.114]